MGSGGAKMSMGQQGSRLRWKIAEKEVGKVETEY